MSNIFVIGGAGKVARRFIGQASERGHTVRALHRHPEQATELAALGGVAVSGSLTELSVSGLAELMKGSDVALFSAGAGGKGGPEMTNAIDGGGLELAVDAAKEAGINRFLLVSVFPDALRDEPRSEGFENYIRVKKQSDVYLAESGLDWVILRPGTLSDSPGTGRVRLGPAVPYGVVPRDDVAATLVHIVGQPQVRREIIELTEGSIPVEEAVASLVR